MPANDSQLKILIRTFSNCGEPGTLAYVFHRLTGLILAGYLFLHLSTISLSTVSPQAFDAKLGTFNQPLFLALDVALLAAATFHVFNGLRIIFFDLGIGIKKQKLSFVLALVLTGIIAVLAAELLIPVFFGKG
ncbi:MAG: succinate dehydrogenase, cytochrome b556 subunit [Candidatus Methanoperedens sp.]|nr:succinate dehydrogenase, cytochrome b556 subunit [Candidatus Methanoperedens sp.]MCZ7395740.1 succinate dehydrogenase, cytochrome b556 subunit [Candidatus Methanoperedens sp.]